MNEESEPFPIDMPILMKEDINRKRVFEYIVTIPAYVFLC